ncbi:hypothetical protein Tco_1019722 [Tanacetum coccineum]|uniref:Xylulose kinase-1 n=1 Tax=Tanacetum coccineum TaxID=301880 RepID=A0ABQ5G0A3_9ASTR
MSGNTFTLDTTGQIKILPPKTAEEMVLRERERKARTTLLMAIPEDHLAKFHKMTDAKDMWIAIKSRFGGNDESKRCRKESRALVTVDGECVDWTTHSEDNDNYAFMANNSTGSDTQGIICPLHADIEIDDSKYTYGPEKTQPNEPDSQTNEVDACDSNISTETSELVFEPVVNESHVEVQPKVWSDAPIIEEYESDRVDNMEIVPLKGTTVLRTKLKNQKIYIAKVKAVSTVGEKWVIVLSPQQVVNGSKLDYTNSFFSKLTNGGSSLRNHSSFKKIHRQNQAQNRLGSLRETESLSFECCMEYTTQNLLKNKGIIDSGCYQADTESDHREMRRDLPC